MDLIKKMLVVLVTVASLFSFYAGSRAIVAYNTRNLVYTRQEAPLKIVMEEAKIERMTMKAN
ncbi:hypothetical protein [Thermosediminibacter oceani]|uniref:Uncharacterized protein n=1 Tax=Thermosediminibacter oceani (strain ATCC BAA-1034 / DSM 16646 / JW/IW-1228P) TaxID=555079 RepID=D9S2U8_THEOJ|nr:hypothetical protein [Thermosediminibacter oceani]ADL07725.1 hypothetical protein Toce_0963 [Thermosediminibacter oceani DSM 16646]